MSEFENKTISFNVSDKNFRRFRSMYNGERKCVCSDKGKSELLLVWKSCVLKQCQPQFILELAVAVRLINQRDSYILICEPAVLLWSVKKKMLKRLLGLSDKKKTGGKRIPKVLCG